MPQHSDDLCTKASWKQNCRLANETQVERLKALKQNGKEQQTEIKALKKELNRKERALAEAAALLVLRKKYQAIWGEDADA